MKVKILLSLLTISASALPSPAVVPLADTCASYPKYDNTTDIAGPWPAIAVSTGRDIEGYSIAPLFSTAVGGFRWGLIAVPTAAPTTDMQIRCVNNALQAHLDMGVSGMIWQELVIATTRAEAALGFGLSNLPDPTTTVEPYQHIADGRPESGVFLGYGNITTWGFNYVNATGLGEFYWLRLLGPGSNNLATGKPLNEGEFTGYIKILA